MPKTMQIGSEEAYSYLCSNTLSYISLTPSQLMLIDFSRMSTLQTVLILGEHFQKVHFDHLRKGFDGLIINSYGATETTMCNLLEFISANDEYTHLLGTPLANTRFYILDEISRIVPNGGIGEICMVGPGIARGYFNRPDEDTKHFVSNSLQTDEDKKFGRFDRMYKTGDLARWTFNGKIEILGRKDNQVEFFFKWPARFSVWSQPMNR